MPDLTLHERLVVELKVIRRSGLHRLQEHLEELPTLAQLAGETMGAATADDIERMLRAVYTQRSEGAQGTAIGILLGLEQGRRGASPRVLRKVAATRLGYQSVDTFRKNPEVRAIATFARLLESYAVDIRTRPIPEGQRIEKIMDLIEQLSLAEYGELVRRLRHRIMSLTDDAPDKRRAAPES